MVEYSNIPIGAKPLTCYGASGRVFKAGIIGQRVAFVKGSMGIFSIIENLREKNFSSI
jgi:hypothetical protein